MPISPALISHAEVHVLGQLVAGGSRTVNTDYVFHFRRTTVVNPLVKVDLDTIFQSTIVSKILLAVNVRWTQLTNTIRWLDDANDPALPIAHVNLGAQAGDGMDSAASVFVLFRTAWRGKNYRGGKHFAGLSEGDTTQPVDDILNAGAITRFQNLITAMGTPLVDASGNTWVLEVFSRTISNVQVNPTFIIATDVNSILLNKRISQLKKRAPKSVY